MFFTQVYTPPRTIVAHDYKHTQGDPTHYKWNGKGGPRIQANKTILAERERANVRIWTLLDMPGGDRTPGARDMLQPYGLGTRRTLDQLIAFTGIFLRNRTIGPNRCGNVDWVPWDCGAARGAHPVFAQTPPPILDLAAAERRVAAEFGRAEAAVAMEFRTAEAAVGRGAARVEAAAREELLTLEQMAADRALRGVLHPHHRGRGAEAAAARPEPAEPLPKTTVALGLVCLWTAYKAFAMTFSGKAKRAALGLPVAKEV